MTSVKSRSRQAKRSLKKVASGAASQHPLKQWRLSKTLYRRLDDYQKRGVDFALEVKTAALLFGRVIVMRLSYSIRPSTMKS